jgi:hypothetical protein
VSSINASLIDQLEIQLSGKCFQTTLAVNQQSVIDGFNLLVRQAGWTLIEDFYPTGAFNMVLGAPFTFTSPILDKTMAGCGGTFLAIGGVNFVLYDPNTQYPNPAAACVLVPMGTTGAQTIVNLANAITAATEFNATINTITAPASLGPGTVSYAQIFITGKVPGPTLNFVPMSVNGAYGVVTASTTLGGGYALQSVEQIPNATNPGVTSAFQVKLTCIANAETDGGAAVAFAFNLNNQGGPTYLLDLVAAEPPPITGYNLICNPYSFAIFDNSDDDSFPYNVRETSLAAFAPYIPLEEGFQACYAVFVLGSHNLRTGTMWGFGPNNYKLPITTCLDSAPATYNNFPACPRCLAFRQPGTLPLLTPDGQPLITTAWIMMGGDPWHNVHQNPAVVGRLWDCAVVSDVTTGLSINGNNYVKLGSQDGSNGLTRSTLVMCNGTAPNASATAPSPATSGMVLISGGSDFNLIPGTGLAWVRGDIFAQSLVGSQIYLGTNNSGPFTVQWVSADGHTMIVEPPVGFTFNTMEPWSTQK